jgi:hypothetical protein
MSSNLAKKFVKGTSYVSKRANGHFLGQQIGNALAKNSVFHDQSEHIDTKFHFVRDCVTKRR